MNQTQDTHPLDLATRLTPTAPNRFEGATHPAYGNMVGPFGGIIAATMLNAPLTHAERLGDPLALTVNYAGPIADGGFEIAAMPSRTNRSTQHWTMTLSQNDTVAITGSAVFAKRRETWTATEAGFPEVPAPETIQRTAPGDRNAWTHRYDMRFVLGGMPAPGTAAQALEPREDSLSWVWIRDLPVRPLDFLSLASICDAFFPRVYVRRQQFVPASTVSMTVYFHVDADQLAAHGDQAVLGTARASHFGKGYHDQAVEIWSRDGVMLATSHQVVYYKD